MLIFYDFIQLYVLTTNHHLKIGKCSEFHLGLFTFWKRLM